MFSYTLYQPNEASIASIVAGNHLNYMFGNETNPLIALELARKFKHHPYEMNLEIQSLIKNKYSALIQNGRVHIPWTFNEFKAAFLKAYGFKPLLNQLFEDDNPDLAMQFFFLCREPRYPIAPQVKKILEEKYPFLMTGNSQVEEGSKQLMFKDYRSSFLQLKKDHPEAYLKAILNQVFAYEHAFIPLNFYMHSQHPNSPLNADTQRIIQRKFPQLLEEENVDQVHTLMQTHYVEQFNELKKRYPNQYEAIHLHYLEVAKEEENEETLHNFPLYRCL